DGYELVRRLRALPGGAEVPILAFSGLLSRADEAKVAAAGFDDMIPKPVEPSRLAQLIRAHLPADTAPTSTAALAFGAGRRLLVVDADPVQRKLACYLLRKAGFEVAPAGSGDEALRLARANPPDAVVSDVLMPGTDGFALSLAMRRDERLGQTPIILASNSYGDAADQALAE